MPPRPYPTFVIQDGAAHHAVRAVPVGHYDNHRSTWVWIMAGGVLIMMIIALVSAGSTTHSTPSMSSTHIPIHAEIPFNILKGDSSFNYHGHTDSNTDSTFHYHDEATPCETEIARKNMKSTATSTAGALSEVTVVGQQFSAAHAQMEFLGHSIDEKEGLLANQTRKIESLKQSAAELKLKNSTLFQDTQVAQKELTVLVKQMEMVNRHLQFKVAELDEHTASYSSRHGTSSPLEDEIAEALRKVREQESIVAGLKSKVCQGMSEPTKADETLKQKVNELNKQQSVLEAEKDKIEKRKTAVQNQITSLDSSLNVVVKDRAAFRAMTRDAQLTSIDASILRLVTENIVFQNEIEAEDDFDVKLFAEAALNTNNHKIKSAQDLRKICEGKSLNVLYETKEAEIVTSMNRIMEINKSLRSINKARNQVLLEMNKAHELAQIEMANRYQHMETCRNAQTDLNEAVAHLQTLQKALDALLSTQTDLKHFLSTVEKIIASINKDLEQLRAQIADLKEQITPLSEQVATRDAQEQQYNAQLQDNKRSMKHEINLKAAIQRDLFQLREQQNVADQELTRVMELLRSLFSTSLLKKHDV